MMILCLLLLIVDSIGLHHCLIFINILLQVWHAVISTGPGNFPLNASYKTADSYEFQVFNVLCHLIFGFIIDPSSLL